MSYNNTSRIINKTVTSTSAFKPNGLRHLTINPTYFELGDFTLPRSSPRMQVELINSKVTSTSQDFCHELPDNVWKRNGP